MDKAGAVFNNYESIFRKYLSKRDEFRRYATIKRLELELKEAKRLERNKGGDDG